MDAILKLHEQIKQENGSVHRRSSLREASKRRAATGRAIYSGDAVGCCGDLSDSTLHSRRPASGTRRRPDPRRGGVRDGMFGAQDGGDTSGFGGLVQAIALAPAAARPFGDWFDDCYDALARAYPDVNAAVEKVVIEHGR